MKTPQVPPAISEYIKDKFRDNFLTEIKSIESDDGHLQYIVDVSHDNTFHHLKFNSEGILIGKKLEPINELNDGEDDIEQD
jgi:hypothetical protein